MENTGAIEDRNLTKEGIVDLLAEDIPPEEKEKGKEIEEEKGKEEEEDEDEEIKIVEGEEEEDESVEEEKLEEIVVAPRKKEILKDFPEIFKKYPYLEVALYRDKAFTEIIGTVADAKELVEKSKELETFQGYIAEGDTVAILKEIKEKDGEAFNKTVDNYLENLAKVDNDAYYHVVGSIVNRAIEGMVKRAKEMGVEKGEDILDAAAILNQFIFGRTEYKATVKLSKDEDKKDDTVQKEREEFFKERFETAQGELSDKIDNKVKSTIEQHIDKNGVMTDYVKRNAIRDAMGALEELMKGDRQFRTTVLDRLWKDAVKDKFSRASLERIEKAWLSKAKTLLPKVISNARAEALKGNSGMRRPEKDRSGKIAEGRSTSSTNRGHDKKEVPQGMKTFDFLNSD